MKTFLNLIIVLFSLSTSCESQEVNQKIHINYKAQTRGFLYKISLNNNVLEIDNNGTLKSKILNSQQFSEIEKLVFNINFDEIKNNISIDDLAVDKAIEGVFEVKINSKTHLLNLNHNNLPVKIEELFSQLERYLE
ncbi:hypothetical protein [Lutibacter maritimus]|uniref:Uncharacterized protein n=1 Tax=Lutibacter maritimus TaxID=593133 RepID=A0A1I6PS96_9FLAO|nr:hypothetical protein [Lutibacter maritimus]SFS42915.1 hypothetical protein SAMN04488006_1303 [Lutibacter maritimus]